MSESNTVTAALKNARRFNANGNQKISRKQAKAIENNKFLRSVITELDHQKTTSAENITRLRNIFSSLKNYKGLEKYLYEVTISLGLSRKPDFIALAKEFNTILTEQKL